MTKGSSSGGYSGGGGGGENGPDHDTPRSSKGRNPGRGKRKAKGERIIVAPYEVGFGKPPVSGRIQKGERRNPRGRPRKPRPGERGLDDFLDEVVTIDLEGRKTALTKRELAYLQIANRAAKGDDRAIRLMLAFDASKAARGEEADPLTYDPQLADKLLKAIQEETGGAGKQRPRDGAKPPTSSRSPSRRNRRKPPEEPEAP